MRPSRAQISSLSAASLYVFYSIPKKGIAVSKSFFISILSLSLFAGCASVPMESPEASAQAKKFEAPSAGNAGIYVYRAGSFGAALKKNIYIDGKCIGESAPNVFFYELAKGEKEYKISTESEFSPNDLLLKASAGKNYYVRQYIKLGVFVGGAGLELVSDEEAKKAIGGLALAKKGTCS